MTQLDSFPHTFSDFGPRNRLDGSGIEIIGSPIDFDQPRIMKDRCFFRIQRIQQLLDKSNSFRLIQRLRRFQNLFKRHN